MLMLAGMLALPTPNWNLRAADANDSRGRACLCNTGANDAHDAARLALAKDLCNGAVAGCSRCSLRA